jgi:hypothetical protein
MTALPSITQEQSDAIAAIRRRAYDESPEYRAFVDAAVAEDTPFLRSTREAAERGYKYRGSRSGLDFPGRLLLSDGRRARGGAHRPHPLPPPAGPGARHQ